MSIFVNIINPLNESKTLHVKTNKELLEKHAEYCREEQSSHQNARNLEERFPKKPIKWEWGEYNNANLKNANLQNSNFLQSHLQNTDLSDTNLQHTNLKNVTLGNSNLTNANMSGADMKLTNLTNANLTNANLTNANLTNANLMLASLEGANMSGADLRGANLFHADLGGAIMTGAILIGTLSIPQTRDTSDSINTPAELAALLRGGTTRSNALTQYFEENIPRYVGIASDLAKNPPAGVDIAAEDMKLFESLKDLKSQDYFNARLVSKGFTGFVDTEDMSDHTHIKLDEKKAGMINYNSLPNGPRRYITEFLTPNTDILESVLKEGNLNRTHLNRLLARQANEQTNSRS